MPRTLNPALARFAGTQDNNNTNRNFRVTHRGDIIPSAAVPAFFGFSHISPSYFITTNNVQPPAAKDIIIVTGDVTIGLDGNPVTAHRMYFNDISACTTNPFPLTLTVAEFLAAMGVPEGTPIPDLSTEEWAGKDYVTFHTRIICAN
jgi:hypothetical protein